MRLPRRSVPVTDGEKAPYVPDKRLSRTGPSLRPPPQHHSRTRATRSCESVTTWVIPETGEAVGRYTSRRGIWSRFRRSLWHAAPYPAIGGPRCRGGARDLPWRRGRSDDRRPAGTPHAVGRTAAVRGRFQRPRRTAGRGSCDGEQRRAGQDGGGEHHAGRAGGPIGIRRAIRHPGHHPSCHRLSQPDHPAGPGQVA